MKKLGLVLAGGGGKGAYQIGVWKALKESGLDKKISAVSGTSVGALNACLFVQGDYSLAENIWVNEIKDKILHLDAEDILKKIAAFLSSLAIKQIIPMTRLMPYINLITMSGIFSRKGMLEIIDKHLNLKNISNSNIEMFATCFCFDNIKPNVEYFQINNQTPNRVKSILCATSAIPGVFESEKIDGRIYFDGGIPLIGDNTPVRPLYEKGCDSVIVVHLDRSVIIEKNKYKNIKIYEIFPQDRLGGIFSGTLDFSPTGAKKRIEQGFKDTMKILEPVISMYNTNIEALSSMEDICNDEKEHKIKMNKLEKEKNKLKQDIYKK